MNPNDLQPTTPWHLAERAEAMNPSAIREILKVTERPGILNFAGGLPSPETFPVDAMRDACATVLGKDSAIAKPSLQYASSEGLPSCASGWPMKWASTAPPCRPSRCSSPPAASRGWT